MTYIRFMLLWPVLFMAVGCEREEITVPAAPARESAAADEAATSTVASAAPRVVFLGDSLTAGMGLEAEEAFPAVLGRLLDAEGLPIEAVNAGVSGDSTAGGLRRLDWILRQTPAVVVIGLGANDGLRAIGLQASEDNLRATIERSRAAGARVLLLGMQIPPNYGPEYATRFRELYPKVAREMQVPLVPFLLEGVGGDFDLNQPDGIHPTAEGHRRLAENVLPHLREIVQQVHHERAAAASP